MIVDGQQRLTSLYSVFRGGPVVDQDYRPRRIEIAFRPRDGKFEVTDAAIRKDPELIPDISQLWASGKPVWTLVNNFLKSLECKRPLTEEEKEQMGHNLNRGCRVPPGPGSGASPYNHFIHAAPDQLLRVAVALGLYRSRLKSVYQLLRGKDLATGEFSPQRRDDQFGKLRDSQASALNLTWWHQFFAALVGAGFRSGELISSENTLLHAYALYLIGRTRYAVPTHELDRLIGRWFYTITLSGRYTGAFETVADSDLTLIRDLSDRQSFVDTVAKIMQDTLTPDLWTTTLPNNLARISDLTSY